MDMLDRVFGSCFRSWGVKENVGDNKYIDYLPTRKWKYSDHNLMKDLSENNPSDVMDLADDSQGQTSSNIKLRLHDNVFLNPLNESGSRDVVNESTESEEIIMEHTPQIIAEENNNTIEASSDEERKVSQDALLPSKKGTEPANDVENEDKVSPVVLNGDYHAESDDDIERKVSNDVTNEKASPNPVNGDCSSEEKEALPVNAECSADGEVSPVVVHNECSTEEEASPVIVNDKCGTEEEEASPVIVNNECSTEEEDSPVIVNDKCSTEEEASPVIVNDTCGTEEEASPVVVNDKCSTEEEDSPVIINDKCGTEEEASPVVVNNECSTEEEVSPVVVNGDGNTDEEESYPVMVNGDCCANSEDDYPVESDEEQKPLTGNEVLSQSEEVAQQTVDNDEHCTEVGNINEECSVEMNGHIELSDDNEKSISQNKDETEVIHREQSVKNTNEQKNHISEVSSNEIHTIRDG